MAERERASNKCMADMYYSVVQCFHLVVLLIMLLIRRQRLLQGFTIATQLKLAGIDGMANGREHRIKRR